MTSKWTSKDLLTGREKEKEVIEFSAGPVKGIFDPNIGFLRQIRLGDHELIRGIYMAVRDNRWKTLPIELEITHSDIGMDSFEIQFNCINKMNDAEFQWAGTISGDETGSIMYAFTGTAQTDFERMRLGLCLLHPENECAGKSLNVTHSDGSREETKFSQSVAPIAPEPVVDINALNYEAAPGVQVKFTFKGDTFEMEDQRNWTDASYKTYCTPASLPRPVNVKKGDMISQSIRMELIGETKRIFPIIIGRAPQFNISTTPVLSLPPVGLNVGPFADDLSGRQADLLKKLNLSHLRADLLPENDHWKVHLEKLAAQAQTLNLPVHIALSEESPQDHHLSELKNECEKLGITPKAIQLIGMKGKVLSEETIENIKQSLSNYFPDSQFGVGSDKDFAQVNANRHLSKSQLHPVYGICPQVHAFDNLTLVENLTGQCRGVECLQDWWPQSPMVASVHLHRYPGARALYDKSQSEKEWDSRHPSLFGAAWTLGSLAKLIETNNTHSITYYETSGLRGILAPEATQSIPPSFKTIAGAPYPMYFVFKSFLSARKALKTISSHPWQTQGITLLDSSNKRTIIISNFTAENNSIKVKTGTCAGSMKSLNQNNILDLMNAPEDWDKNQGESIESKGGKIHLDLDPYSITFFEES